MARFKAYDYNQLMMVPVSLEQQLVPGTLEYAIHHLVQERLDTSEFDAEYCNDETGRTAYDPKVLLKIVLLGYARGMMSSRKIERACQENILFMALSCGQRPDHSTIAAFVSGMSEERIESLFTQVLMICEEEGLLGGTHFSIDGLKLSSNASKEWSGTHADLRKKQEKLQEKVREAMAEHQEADRRGGDADAKRLQHRKERLEHSAGRIEKYLTETQPRMGRRGKEIQGNITDPQSAKLVSSHGVVQGYNANAMVDEKCQVIVHAEAFGEGDDAENVAPMLQGAEEHLKAAGYGEEPLKGRTISADTGYYSLSNLEACRDYEVDAFIPDRAFRKRDLRFAEAFRHRRSVDKHKKRYKSKKRWFTVDDIAWDDGTQKLICPAGHPLRKNGAHFETADGYLATSYRTPERFCSGCALRSKCLRNPKGRSRQVRLFHGRRPGSLGDAMKRKIDTKEGRSTYSKRLGIVEPVFGNIRAQKGMDRFTLRGRKKVNIQWKLYCLVHNVEKLGKHSMELN